MPCGVKLEQGKGPSLENEIISVPAPKGLPAPKMFAPLRKKAGAAKILAAAKMACIIDGLDGEALERKLLRWSDRKVRALCAVCFDDGGPPRGEKLPGRAVPRRGGPLPGA